MTSAVRGKSPVQRPQHRQLTPRKDCGPGPGAEPDPEASARSAPRPAVAPRDRHAGAGVAAEQLCPGKQQLMEKFFTPLQQCPKMDPQHQHHQHHSHPSQHNHRDAQRRHRTQPPHEHHHHHHQQGQQWAEEREAHGYATPQGNTSGHHRHHRHSHHSAEEHHEQSPHPRCGHHHHHRHRCQHHHGADVTSHACTHTSGHTSAPASFSSTSSSSSSSSFSSSSSSSSSTSSSSSSTWSSEASINNGNLLMDRKPGFGRPRHSQSCTDICRGRLFEEDDEEDTQPLLEDDNHLYKSASLERSLALHDDDKGQKSSNKAKKALSSIVIPTKGILKNRQGHGGLAAKAGNFRKAKSMEALSRQEEKAGVESGTWGRGTGKSKMDEKDLRKKREEARQNFVKEKLQFSAFLNEITRQVLSPSRLSSLGVTNNSRPCSPGQTSLMSPREERGSAGRNLEDGKTKQPQKQPDSPDSAGSSVHSDCSKKSQPSKHQSHHHRHHHSACGITQNLRHHPEVHMPDSHTDTSTSPENSPCLGQAQGNRVAKQQQAGSTTRLTDGTSTSPELSPRLPRHHPHHPHHHPHHPNHPHTHPHHHYHHHHHHHHASSPQHLCQQRSPQHPLHESLPQHPHHESSPQHPHYSPSQHPHHQSSPQQPHHESAPLHPYHQCSSQHSHHEGSPQHPQHQCSPQHPHHPIQAQHPGSHRAQEQESHFYRSDSSQNTSKPDAEENQEKMSDVDRIRFLQDQNQALQHSLLQTAARMECMGAEFKSSHQQLEAELQRTRVELSSLKDKFKRLQENYSSTQQMNHLLEQKLHSVAQNMDGERKHLNQRISELTEQLSTAKTTIQTLENINVPSLLQEALEKHFQSEEAVNQFLLQVAPPPVQFMDSEPFDKAPVAGDVQVLGPVMEEEESDWSEAGEELQSCGLRGPGRGQHNFTAFLPWKQDQSRWIGMERDHKREGDTESESGGEEAIRQPPPRPLQIPHLQFSMHPETLPVPTADVSLTRFKSAPDRPVGEGCGIAATRKLGSPIRILSASLEEIHTTSKHQQQRLQDQPGPATLKCTEALLDLRRAEGGVLEDSDEDEILSTWKMAPNKGSTGVGTGDTFESSTTVVSYQSATRMLNHFICELHPAEVEGQGRVEVQGWAGGVTEDMLNGESTQL